MHRKNTAYWPERYTPTSLLEKAAIWRNRAKAHLDVAASVSALKHLEKNAERIRRDAQENPSPQNLNSAGSISNLVADGAHRLAEDLVALEDDRCPEPPAFAIVYREPQVEGVPENWIAEVYTICGIGQTAPVLRTVSTLAPERCQSKDKAISALKELAKNPRIEKIARRDDYLAARVRAGIRCALETEPVEVPIRIAGEKRPENWEAPR